jgi:ankyrin repeat protein/Tfp pilus assembly protein PilP
MRISTFVLISFSMLAFSLNIYSDSQQSQKNSSKLVSIKLNSIQSRSYLNHIADLADINLVISSEFRNERIDSSQDAIAVIDLINNNAKKQGLLHKKVNNILIVASECRFKNANISNDKTYLADKLSLNSSSVSLDAILQSLEVISNLKIYTSGIDLSYPVTIHIKSKQIKDILQAIAIAEGWLINQKPDKSVWLTINPKVESCNQSTNNYPETREAPLLTELTSLNEDRNHPKVPSRREALEQYDLEGITVLGRIDSIFDHTRKVLIETPDKKVFSVQVGNYVGRNIGRITNIDDSGNTDVSEIVPDSLGRYLERKITLKSGIKYLEPRTILLKNHLAPTNSTPIQNEFIQAVKRGDLDKLKYLLPKGVNIDASFEKSRGNAIAYAIEYKHQNIISWLISQGADINSITADRQLTPLHMAVLTENINAAKLLIKTGSKIDLGDSKKWTALHWAAAKRNEQMVKLLLSAGADPFLTTYIGFNALTVAALEDSASIINIFLDEGCNINQRDRNGDTMLSAAVYAGNKSIVEMLIDRGADIFLQHNEKGSLLDIANKYGHAELSALLISKGVLCLQVEGPTRPTKTPIQNQ